MTGNILLNHPRRLLTSSNRRIFERFSNRFMKNVLLTGVTMLLGFAGFCQQKVVADKIIGIVGDKIVLKSEIFIANEDIKRQGGQEQNDCACLLYTSPSPRDRQKSRMPSS